MGSSLPKRPLGQTRDRNGRALCGTSVTGGGEEGSNGGASEPPQAGEAAIAIRRENDAH